MGWELKLLAYYLIFIFAIFTCLVFFVESLWIPFSRFWRNRRSNQENIQDIVKLNQERVNYIERQQDIYKEKAFEKEIKRRSKEEERNAWITELKKRRIVSTKEGHKLGTREEEKEIEEDPISQARKLREQQDREFEESLRKDQQKDEQLRKRKEVVLLKEKRIKQIMMKLEYEAPIPPSKLTEGVCSIGIRLPNGQRLQRNFYANTKLQSLYDYVEANGDLQEQHNFQLVMALPRQVYSRRNETLEEAGLIPKAVLIVEEIQNPIDLSKV